MTTKSGKLGIHSSMLNASHKRTTLKPVSEDGRLVAVSTPGPSTTLPESDKLHSSGGMITSSPGDQHSSGGGGGAGLTIAPLKTVLQGPGTDRLRAPSISTLMFMKKRMTEFNSRQRRGRRTSDMGRGKQVVENTYRLEPKPSEKYRSDAVARLINNSLKFFLDGMKYEPVACAKVSKMICEDIKRKLKYNFLCPRYKFIIQTVVTERVGQGVEVASRAIIDQNLDNSASGQYIKGSLCGSVNVFWVYFE